MSKPNETQVGGDHYRKHGFIQQHWDLVSYYGWDYFQGQVTKYLMRWKDKGETEELRIRDLKKARHFLDKYIEEAEKFGSESFPSLTTSNPRHGLAAKDPPVPVLVPKINPAGWVGFTYEGGSKGVDYFRCQACKMHFKIEDGAPPYTVHQCEGQKQLQQNADYRSLVPGEGRYQVTSEGSNAHG